jgi:hypothetical protein
MKTHHREDLYQHLHLQLLEAEGLLHVQTERRLVLHLLLVDRAIKKIIPRNLKVTRIKMNNTVLTQENKHGLEEKSTALGELTPLRMNN